MASANADLFPVHEPLSERMARFKSGRWTHVEPYRTSAQVPVNRYGVKRRKNVYRAQATRWDGQRQQRELCGHNHIRLAAAETCTRALVRELNREDGL